MRGKNYIIILGTYLLFFFSCGRPDLSDEILSVYQELPDQLDFNTHVKPILSDKCFACHGPDKAKQKAGLRLDLKEGAFGELPESPGEFAIVPRNLKKSAVIQRILSTDPNLFMPPPEFKVELTDYEKAVLVKWIEDGAEYKPHWAFIKPEMPKVPKVDNKNFTNHTIDHFIVKKLEKLGLKTFSASRERIIAPKTEL